MHQDTRAYDVAIVGGGIVGLATGMALSRACASLIVLEAESHLATHQTGHNSGVIHSGLYYKPGSLKARLCVDGREAMYVFCREHDIAHERCGKLVVAVDEEERERLTALHERGTANGLDNLELVEGRDIKRFEPSVEGVGGLYVPQTGIVDFTAVARAMARVIEDGGHAIRTAARVRRIRVDGRGLTVGTSAGPVRCSYLINCGGLQSDRIARSAGLDPGVRIVPFRGDYFELVPASRRLVRNLVYPVPDPRLPFLGVHFTRQLDGAVLVGPSAVPALSRNGYGRARISPADLWETVSFRGTWRLARSHWRNGGGEIWRTFNKRAFVRAARRLIPSLSTSSVRRAWSGIRAQAVDRDGQLIDDFRIVESDRSIHVVNAPSPAATASISIGRYIADLARKRFDIA